MKRFVVLGALLLLAGGSLWLAQNRKVETTVGPGTLMGAVAVGQHELTRLPMSATRLSDQEEIRIGDQIAAQYEQRFATANAPSNAEQAKTEAYVNDVGRKVSARARRKLPYRFHYVPEEGFVNAFALPGGHVFIGKGLIQLMDTEDSLAAVLGHEVEHIDRYHCAERYQIEARLRHVPLGGLVALPIALFEAGYSKDQELEADTDGTRLAVWAGYSPQGAIHLFQAFAKLEPGDGQPSKNPPEEISRVAFQSLVEYFRSHPRAQDRIRNIQQLIATEHWPPQAERKLRSKPVSAAAAGK